MMTRGLYLRSRLLVLEGLGLDSLDAHGCDCMWVKQDGGGAEGVKRCEEVVFPGREHGQRMVGSTEGRQTFDLVGLSTLVGLRLGRRALIAFRRPS